jgi:hypothetical protein
MWNLHCNQMVEIPQLDHHISHKERDLSQLDHHSSHKARDLSQLGHLSSHKERDENKGSHRNNRPMLLAWKEDRKKVKQVSVI